MKNTIVLFILLYVSVCNGQNHLPNGDFEDYTSLPNALAQYSDCTGWSNCSGIATPDYFHMNGSGNVQLPNCFIGTVSPQSGSAVMGIIIWHDFSFEYREYISHVLSAPLTIGQVYSVSFYITNGISNGGYGGCGTDHMSVAFSTNPLVQNQFEPMLSVVPQYVMGAVLYDTLWQQVSFNFTADSAYNYITLGNFASDVATVHQQFEPSNDASAYYFIDDISVTSDDPNGIESLTVKHGLSVYPTIFSDNLNIETNNETGTEFSLFDIDSKIILHREISGSESIDTRQLAKGIYIYRARSKEGTIQNGKLVKE